MKKELKKNYKQNKKKLKKEFKENKKLLKQQYFNSLPKKEIKHHVNNPPKRSVLEEIGNATTHGVGTIFSIIAFLMMLKASETKTQIMASIIYFIGLFIMFTMSCLYHSFKYGSSVKRLFRRFDYSSIYLLIGATFVPILLLFIGGTFGIIFVIVQWVIIITGITFIGVFGPHKLRPLHITLYIVLGWSGLILLPKMLMENITLFYYILGGGIIYTLGIIPFAIKAKVSHFIWHFFVLFGAIVQFIGIFICLY